MTKQLQDRVAVVTGASNGIGRGIAEMFAAEGAKTVLVARRADVLNEVAAGIRARGGEALPVPTDLTQEREVVALFDTVRKSYGRLDVLVNNAGVATHLNTEDITLDYWREVLDINITAAFLCSREAIRIMKDQQPQGGRIINMGSVSAKTPRPDSLPYTTTKFGVVGLSQGTQKELSGDGVQVTALCPAFVATNMTDWVEEQVPKDEMIQPEDIGEAVRYLLKTSPNCVVPEIQFLRPGDNQP